MTYKVKTNKNKEYCKTYYWKNIDKFKARNELKKDEISKKKAQYYLENTDVILEKTNAYKRDNPEKVFLQKKVYRERPENKEKMRAYWTTEQRREWKRQNYQKHREENQAKRREHYRLNKNRINFEKREKRKNERIY